MQGGRRHVRALVIAPTRELAEQIHEAIGTMGRQTRLRSVSIYGGVSMNPQIQKLRSGVEIVVACPGRLLDHMNHGMINLSHLEVLVLDEADWMFDMGFLPDIRKIIKHVPAKRQTLLFSATMPDDIRRLAREVLRTPGHRASRSCRTGRAEKTGDAFSFITREDEDVVRSIERVLGEKVERRTMKEFDYKKAAPAHDTEFVRSQRLRKQNKPETSEAHSVSAASQKRRKGRSSEVQRSTIHHTGFPSPEFRRFNDTQVPTA